MVDELEARNLGSRLLDRLAQLRIYSLQSVEVLRAASEAHQSTHPDRISC